MTTPSREHLIKTIRNTWPDAGSGYYPARAGYFQVPPVQDGGVTARLIEHAVDTVIAELNANNANANADVRSGVRVRDEASRG
jgi:hypothetical protein